MRGRAHYYKGEYEQALDDFKEQTRLDPKNWVAFHWLACMLATCPTASIRDGDAAVKAATSACELKGGKDPDCIGALAGAYAEAGDFGQAVKYQKELLGLEGITEKDRVVYQQRLKLYQSRKPYHMAPR